MLRTRDFAMLAAVIWALVAGATTAGAQPFNDDFASRGSIIFVTDSPVTGSAVGATREPDEPYHWWVGEGGSVWFDWLAFEGCYTIDTCGSDFDTVLAVYKYGPYLLEKIASNDDSPTCTTGTRQSSVTVELSEFEYYVIAVAGFQKKRRRQLYAAHHAVSATGQR